MNLVFYMSKLLVLILIALFLLRLWFVVLVVVAVAAWFPRGREVMSDFWFAAVKWGTPPG